MGFTSFECLEDFGLAFSFLLNDANVQQQFQTFNQAVSSCADNLNSFLLEPKKSQDLLAIPDALKILDAAFPQINTNEQLWVGISKNPGDRNINDYRFVSGDTDTDFFAFDEDTRGVFPWRGNQPILAFNGANPPVEENCVRTRSVLDGVFGLESHPCEAREMVMCFLPCEAIQPTVNPTVSPSTSPTLSPIEGEVLDNELVNEVNLADSYSILFLLFIITSILIIGLITFQVINLKKQLKSMKSVLTLNIQPKKDKIEKIFAEDI